MDTSKTTEDDTIRDSMESGYVATRPRFTRVRRTWPFNIRNLVAEDIRALDEFHMSSAYAARGANSFLFPNLLPNWSFEFPALVSSDLVFGWAVQGVSQELVAISTSTVEDGSQAIKFSTVSGQTVAASTTVTGVLNCDTKVSCNPGEVYSFIAEVNGVQGTLASGVLQANVRATFFNSAGAFISSAFGSLVPLGAGWASYGYQFTVPANAATFQIALEVALDNATGTPITLDGSASVTWDCVGCALLTPLSPYGRTVGSLPLGCLVRFSKMPEMADIGWANGVKVYGAKIELTEV
jgi:hypothetical protein